MEIFKFLWNNALTMSGNAVAFFAVAPVMVILMLGYFLYTLRPKLRADVAEHIITGCAIAGATLFSSTVSMKIAVEMISKCLYGIEENAPVLTNNLISQNQVGGVFIALLAIGAAFLFYLMLMYVGKIGYFVSYYIRRRCNFPRL